MLVSSVSWGCPESQSGDILQRCLNPASTVMTKAPRIALPVTAEARGLVQSAMEMANHRAGHSLSTAADAQDLERNTAVTAETERFLVRFVGGEVPVRLQVHRFRFLTCPGACGQSSSSFFFILLLARTNSIKLCRVGMAGSKV